MTGKESETLSIRVTRIVGGLISPFQKSRVAVLARTPVDDPAVVSINTIATLNHMPCVNKISEGKACNASDWIVLFDPGQECIDNHCRFAKVIKSGPNIGATRCSRINERVKISS